MSIHSLFHGIGYESKFVRSLWLPRKTESCRVWSSLSGMTMGAPFYVCAGLASRCSCILSVWTISRSLVLSPARWGAMWTGLNVSSSTCICRLATFVSVSWRSGIAWKHVSPFPISSSSVEYFSGSWTSSRKLCTLCCELSFKSVRESELAFLHFWMVYINQLRHCGNQISGVYFRLGRLLQKRWS